VTCAVNRTLFDQYLAEKAEAAGARYHLNSRVQSLLLDNGFVKGVNVARGNAAVEQVQAKIVVDAEGISSRLLKQAGLPSPRHEGIVYAVEAEVDNVKDTEPDAVEVYLGSEYAPGFYAWVIPTRDGTAKVGLAAKGGNPKEFLQRLMHRHPVASRKLGLATISRLTFHAISLSGPIEKAYSNGFLAVGDCASQVKPTTGGGVILSLTCARIAAEVASGALNRNDLSEEFLRLYRKRYEETLGFDVRVMLKIRGFLNALSDGKLDKAMRFAARTGLDKALGDIDEIDFQGRLLLIVLRKPTIFAALAYFAILHLPASSLKQALSIQF
jgi:digeranylgeranylglycerophospholipid reductase